MKEVAELLKRHRVFGMEINALHMTHKSDFWKESFLLSTFGGQATYVGLHAYEETDQIKNALIRNDLGSCVKLDEQAENSNSCWFPKLLLQPPGLWQ